MRYLIKHWRGELSLAVSFWVNFVLVNVLFSFAFLLNSERAFTNYPVFLCRTSMVLMGVQLLVVFPWQFAGVWRAGTHRVRRSGRHGLSITVKVFLVLVLLYHVMDAVYHWGFYKETFAVAFFKDDLPDCIFSLKADGTVLHLDGGLGFGVSDRFAAVLSQSPEIEIIIVDSTGGRIYEARKMAEAILARRLNTTTVRGCYSEGILLFAAGEERTLCKGARLGFREYYAPEPFRDYQDAQAEYRQDWGFYQLRGVTKDFQEKLFSAPRNDYWFPSHQELLDGQVIHAVVKLSEILPIQEAIVLGYDTSKRPLTGTAAVTTEQVKGWILGCSGLLWERNRDDFETLAGTEINPIRIQDKQDALAEWWSIKSREDLLNDLLWLSQEGGHRYNFERDGRWSSMMTADELERYLEPYEEYAEKCNDLRVAHQYYQSLGEKSILGWDLSRYLCVCRWGYLCGWLSEREAWELMIPAARKLQETFDSWEDAGENYLIGRHYWSLKHVQEEKEIFDEAFCRLSEMPSSPWNRYPWDLDLSGAYEQIAASLLTEAPQPAIAEPVLSTDWKASLPKPEEMPVIEVPDLSEPNLFFVNILEALEENGLVLVVPDSYATIQSAIEAAKAGDTVFIREGVYDEWVLVDGKRDLHIAGQGADKVTLHLSDTDPNKIEIVRIRNSERVTLSDVTIEDERDYDEGSPGTKSAVRIHDGNGDIVRCRIRNRRGCGFNYYSGGFGAVRQSLIESCAIDGAILLDTTTDVTISECLFRNNGDCGIRGYHGVKLEVCDTFFEDCNTGIFITQEGTRATFSRSHIRRNIGRGIVVSDGALLGVERSIIELNGNNGVYAVDARTHVYIKNSCCRLNNIGGIFIDKGGFADIQNSVIADNHRDGILLKGPSATATIKGLWSGGNEGSGVWVVDAADITMIQSVCHDNGDCGVAIQDESKGVIQNCLFESNKKSGIGVANEGSHVRIEYVQCAANEQCGIYANIGACVEIVNSDCRSNTQSGILVQGLPSRAELRNNFCSNNKKSGIRISEAAFADIEGNVCQWNKQDGIRVFGDKTAAKLKNNRCFRNDSYGIGLWGGCTARIEGCLSEKNYYSGIYVSGKGTQADLNNNQCRGNRFNGILVSNDAGPVTLTQNVCSQNYPSGIKLNTVFVKEVTKNRCLENPWAGIMVNGGETKPVIEDNDLSGNGTWGIRVWGDVEPVIENNITVGNGKGAIFFPLTAETAG
jgi:hypothetical protein